ncbi:MAG: protein kinase [Coprococcus sp.]|nr:protein kinase [Coprococcus sp.]
MATLYALKKETYLAGRYHIQSVIGQGGFGITYIAYDDLKSKLCAIKEYFPREIAKRDFDEKYVMPTNEDNQTLYDHGLKRFLEEADVLWKLQNVESVVCVYDKFEENDTGYYVMEYIDGVTLKKLVKEKGKLGIKIANRVLLDVGTALIQVHEQNIFHRDIKPDNIMIDTKGNIKLIDFGNAKHIERNSKEEQLSVLLTPGFAPFEQYSSKSIQGAFTDVYSLAATVYYMLTGNIPPNSNDRLLSGEKLKFNDDGIPDYIQNAINSAMRVNYKERTQSVYEFLKNMRLLNETAFSSKCKKNGGMSKQVGLQNDAMPSVRQNDKQVNIVSQKKVATPYIDIISGDNAGSKIYLPLDHGVLIGRTKNYAQIVFKQDEYISKKHCEVYYDSIEDSIYITDLSVNGTWVNGYRLETNQIYRIKNDSTVIMANQICSFKVGVMYQ